MNRKSLLLIIALLLLVIGTGCAKQVTPRMNESTFQPPINTSASNENVYIQSFAFDPATLNVKVGDTVTWTNNDTAVHDIKFETFVSPKIGKGETFQYTFSQVGTYDYICGIHPSMKGKIIVE